MWYTHTMEHHSATNRNEMPPFATTQADLEGTVLSEVSQTSNDKFHMISPKHGL